MFTRVVEITTKTGKAKELSNAIYEKVLPILRKHPGFVDETVLVSNTDPNTVLGLSFWKSREDAERYQREDFARVTDTLRNFLEGSPRVRTFDVESSTSHGIAAGRAA